MTLEIIRAKKAIWKALSTYPEFKRGYIDNIIGLLMEELPILKRNVKQRDRLAERIIDLIFKQE